MLKTPIMARKVTSPWGWAWRGAVTAPPASGGDGLLWVEPKDGVAVDASGKPVNGGNSNPANGLTFATSFLDGNMANLKAEAGNKTANGQTQKQQRRQGRTGRPCVYPCRKMRR